MTSKKRGRKTPRGTGVTRAAELRARVERLTTRQQAAVFLLKLLDLVDTGEVRRRDAYVATRAVQTKVREWDAR